MKKEVLPPAGDDKIEQVTIPGALAPGTAGTSVGLTPRGMAKRLRVEEPACSLI